MPKSKYSTTIVPPKGFGKSVSREKQEQEFKNLQSLALIGLSTLFDTERVDIASFSLFHEFPEETQSLFASFASDDLIQASRLILNSDWSVLMLHSFLSEMEDYANVLCDEFHKIVNETPSFRMKVLTRLGIGALNDALLEKHSESVEATVALQELLEGIGGEMIDTGAMYDADGNQEGPRDLVMDFPDWPEVHFRVFHNPRRVETKDILSYAIRQQIKTWEGAK